MGQENLESLRAYCETWSREVWTPEAWRQGAMIDLDLLDPDVVYEDTFLPDHIGEAYRGPEGVVRATQRWIEGCEWLTVELERIVGSGRGQLENPAGCRIRRRQVYEPALELSSNTVERTELE